MVSSLLGAHLYTLISRLRYIGKRLFQDAEKTETETLINVPLGVGKNVCCTGTYRFQFSSYKSICMIRYNGSSLLFINFSISV